MKIRFLCVITALFMPIPALIACGKKSENDQPQLNVRIDADGVWQISTVYYADGKFRDSITGGYADNSRIKAGDTISFDVPDIYTDEFVCELAVIDERGGKITNDKMKITLPGRLDCYDISISMDDSGEYNAKILSVSKE